MKAAESSRPFPLLEVDNPYGSVVSLQLAAEELQFNGEARIGGFHVRHIQLHDDPTPITG